MRLKLITAACLVTVLLLVVSSPIMLGPVPKRSAPRLVRRQYGQRVLGYLGCLIVAFAASGVGSYFIMKQARDEYREESLNNMRALLEGEALKKKQAEDDAAKS